MYKLLIRLTKLREKAHITHVRNVTGTTTTDPAALGTNLHPRVQHLRRKESVPQYHTAPNLTQEKII